MNSTNNGAAFAMVTLIVVMMGAVIGVASALTTNAAGSFSDRAACAKLNESWVEFKGCFHLEGNKMVYKIEVAKNALK